MHIGAEVKRQSNPLFIKYFNNEAHIDADLPKQDDFIMLPEG
jgi:hypothetical protein